MSRVYQKFDEKDIRNLEAVLAKGGQYILPMVDFVVRAEVAIDEVIDVVGRGAIQAILDLSAREVAGPKHPGKAAGDVRWHGEQGGLVTLSDRKLRVHKPRLRRKGAGSGGEVNVPAYEAMQRDGRLRERMLEILMHGVSTRAYETVLPEMAETVGVSKSEVSREFLEASQEALKILAARRFAAVGRPDADATGDAMAGGGHGVAVSSGRAPGDREALP